MTRALCMAAPKFGNGTDWVGRAGPQAGRGHCEHLPCPPQLLLGPRPCSSMYPLPDHKAMGRVTGAHPGRATRRRRAVGRSQPRTGRSTSGPLAILHSVEASKCTQVGGRAARYLVLPLSPAHVQGHRERDIWQRWCGCGRARSIGTCNYGCRCRNPTASQQCPEKYRHWCVRLPGYNDTITVIEPGTSGKNGQFITPKREYAEYFPLHYSCQLPHPHCRQYPSAF
jgi:hypothetical protein